jgi:hypothetical protein
MRIYGLISALACVALGGSASATPAGDVAPAAFEVRPDATLRFSEGSLSTGLGYMWGRGRLTFYGSHHDFNISGAPVAGVKAPSLTATGKVYHLTRLSDFSGKYTAVDMASAAAGDNDGVPMRNEHGVVIVVRVASAVPQESRAAGNVHIQLKE